MPLQAEYAYTEKEYVMLRSCMDALFQIAEKAGNGYVAATSPAPDSQSVSKVAILLKPSSLQPSVPWDDQHLHT